MHLTRLAVDGLRNLSEIHLEPHRELNVFVGENGHGKTNLLEAIHLSAALRPLRKVERPSDLVCFGRDQAVVRAEFDVDGPLRVEVVCEAKGRRASIADKSVRDVSQLASRIGVVGFVPEDLLVVKGAPEVRRAAIDRFAYGLNPSFAEVARRFEQALHQRNSLLRRDPVDEAQLEAFDVLYAQAAAALMIRRRHACAAWAPAVHTEALAIGAGTLDVVMRYAPQIGDDTEEQAALDAIIHAQCAARRTLDRLRRTTTVGPHHDDLQINKDTKKARFLASQGEVRALVLAMKLAAVRLFASARASPPLLLLDDVAGELDAARSGQLFAAVSALGVQTFVTATHTSALVGLAQAPHRLVHIKRGRARSA